MAKLCNANECTGCAACMAACTHGAITFQKDAWGFAYPSIDNRRCVDCKACEKACPALNAVERLVPKEAYACYVVDEAERQKSSSGGLGTLLAKHCIEHRGVVYGCAFVPPMNVKHVRCTTIEEVYRLRGSKYVQSDLTEVLPLLKEDLRAGREVLLIGTPCQVAGVKSRFGRFSTLTLVDLVCHGVPSMQMLCDTLSESVIGKEKDFISFRQSNKYHFSVGKNGTTIYERPIHKDLFLKGFFTGLLFRKSCFSCKYACQERASDMTIADFWKLKSTKIADDGKGVSMALINTAKGNALFDEIKDSLIFEIRPKEEAFAGNEQLNRPFQRTSRETIFKRLYPTFGYKMSIWAAVPERILGTIIKNLLKK